MATSHRLSHFTPPAGARAWYGAYRLEPLDPQPQGADRGPCTVCAQPLATGDLIWHGVTWQAPRAPKGRRPPISHCGHRDCLSKVPGLLDEDRRALEAQASLRADELAAARRELEIAQLDRAALLALLRRERARLNLASSDLVSTHGGYDCVTAVVHDFGGGGTQVTRSNIRQALDRLGELLYGDDWEQVVLQSGARLEMERLDAPPGSASPWSEGVPEQGDPRPRLRLPARDAAERAPEADDADDDATI